MDLFLTIGSDIWNKAGLPALFILAVVGAIRLMFHRYEVPAKKDEDRKRHLDELRNR